MYIYIQVNANDCAYPTVNVFDFNCVKKKQL
jgi:hypothetical protein